MSSLLIVLRKKKEGMRTTRSVKSDLSTLRFLCMHVCMYNVYMYLVHAYVYAYFYYVWVDTSHVNVRQVKVTFSTFHFILSHSLSLSPRSLNPLCVCTTGNQSLTSTSLIPFKRIRNVCSYTYVGIGTRQYISCLVSSLHTLKRMQYACTIPAYPLLYLVSWSFFFCRLLSAFYFFTVSYIM